jgi:hypothetical protein
MLVRGDARAEVTAVGPRFIDEDVAPSVTKAFRAITVKYNARQGFGAQLDSTEKSLLNRFLGNDDAFSCGTFNAASVAGNIMLSSGAKGEAGEATYHYIFSPQPNRYSYLDNRFVDTG